MKKVLTTILAIIYLSTSMGATLHFHYCMDHLISWGFIDHDSKTCSICGMQKADPGNHCIKAKKGCCHDEHRLIKNDKDQKIAQSISQFAKKAIDKAIDQNGLLAKTWIFSSVIVYPTTNAPPGSISHPTYLLNCNFRI